MSDEYTDYEQIFLSDLDRLGGFKQFLTRYHRRLVDERSFPPLGIQKALHTAAPVFGYANAHHFIHDHCTETLGEEKPSRLPDDLKDLYPKLLAELGDFLQRKEIDLREVADAMELTTLDLNVILGQASFRARAHEEVLNGDNKREQATSAAVVNVTLTTRESDAAIPVKLETRYFTDRQKAKAYLTSLIHDEVGDDAVGMSRFIFAYAEVFPTRRVGTKSEDRGFVDQVIQENSLINLARILSQMYPEIMTCRVIEDWI